MIRTFIVEDDFRVARLHQAYVERLDGFTVVGHALTAAQALDDIAALRPDLILMDVYLPDRSGLEVARALRSMPETRPDLLFITAARDVETLRTAMHEGALHYLVKPFSFATFRDKLVQYEQWRRQLVEVTSADQATVDHLFRVLRPEPPDELPKGLSAPTMHVIVTSLGEFDAAASASEVASASGLSRATARRYLDYLAEQGRAERRLRYGSSGRPEHLFRLSSP